MLVEPVYKLYKQHVYSSSRSQYNERAISFQVQSYAKNSTSSVSLYFRFAYLYIIMKRTQRKDLEFYQMVPSISFITRI